MPGDPFAKDPLKYSRKGDDFILYSIGADMKDDGGRIGRKNGILLKRINGGDWIADEGDWVFWPLK